MAKNGGYMTGAELLRALDLAHEDVEIELGGGKTAHVMVWELDGLETQRIHEILNTLKKEYRNIGTREQAVDVVVEPTMYRAVVRLAGLAMKDEKGRRLFETEEQAGRLPQRSLEKVFGVAARLSPGLFFVPQAVTAEAAETDAGKGSSQTPPDTGTSV